MSTVIITPSIMPRAVATGRREVCRRCPSPCEAFTAGRIDHADGRSKCPLPDPRWRPWAEVVNRQQMRKRGLGDVVAAVAQPIARGIDAVAGTDLANCAGCGQRKKDWNKAVPDVLRPLRRK